MKGNIGLKLKGNYHVEIKDSITGEIKNSNTFHNTATYYLGNVWVRGNLGNADRRRISHLSVGNGVPSSVSISDSSLNHELWGIGKQSFSSTQIDYNTFKYNVTFVFPATSSYVTPEGQGICEAGLRIGGEAGDSASQIITHSLFTDSNDNIIRIDKTSLDILTITVELEISVSNNNSNNFIPVKNSPIIQYMMQKIDFNNDWRTSNAFGGFIGLIKYDEDVNYKFIIGDHLASSIGSYNMDCIYSSGIIWNKTDYINTNGTCGMRFNTRRIPNTSITTENYYRGIIFQYYGSMLLPNETLFPTYTISDIAIGTGDGETNVFENPLSYFKENTEIIKINGTALTRGTDYIINHRGNINKKFEICQDIKPVTALSDIKIDDEVWGNCTYRICSMFKPTVCSKKTISEFDTATECYGINVDNPVILDYGEEQTFNFIKGYNIKLLRKTKSSGAFSQTTTTATIYIDSSDDGETFENVGQVAIASNSISLDFDESVTARYWRIRTNQVAEDSTYYYVVAIYSDSLSADCGIAFGNYDPYITFTTAPADGDVITMDVGMDIMMKNQNFVIDLAPTIDITIS